MKEKIHVKLEGREARILREVSRRMGIPVSNVIKMVINVPNTVLPEIEKVKEELENEE